MELQDTVISSTTEAEYMAAVVSIEGSSVVVRIGPEIWHQAGLSSSSWRLYGDRLTNDHHEVESSGYDDEGHRSEEVHGI